jgi:hypothetical protein
MEFYTKYLKYKTKYLQLKKQLGGGKAILDFSDKINLFNLPEMEQLLNPIYGFILCETGYIPNNFHLYENKFIDTTESNIIYRACRFIPGGVQPTKDFVALKPIDFGRCIAIKYINMEHKFIDNITKTKTIFTDGNIKLKEEDKNTLNNYIIKLHKKYINIDTENDQEISFHIILYCMWWSANNYNGILQYYQGIHEVFTLLNNYLSENKYFIYPGFDFEQIQMLDRDTIKREIKENIIVDNKFEENIINLLNKPFNVYEQEQSKSFCNDITYSDCGESTCRNLINLICYNGNTFDIDELKKYQPIPKLIQYYETFTTFNDQSDDTKLITLNGQQLNARDAWSYLIIHDASNNIYLKSTCTTGEKMNYEVGSGLAKDKTISNFFQLIKNLLGIGKWDDIKNEYIEEITDKTDKEGFGEIHIKHNIYNSITIQLKRGHFYMEPIRTEIEELDLRNINPKKIDIIDILLKKEEIIYDVSKNLWIDFTSKKLVEYINYVDDNEVIDINTKKIFKINLLKLSLTKKYDKNIRGKIEINVDNDYFNEFLKLSNEKTKNFLDEYTYLSKNFEFLKKLDLKHLNHKFSDDSSLTKEDLKPLSQLESIGDDFMKKYTGLTNIVLPQNIKTIGNQFMEDCTSLITIDLSGSTNLETIGNNFMKNCTGLINIVLPKTINIKTIGHGFMMNCTSLETIDLSDLSTIDLSGNNFMKNCIGLTKIILPKKIKYIGNNFMMKRTKLETIDLSDLSNLETIGTHFLEYCTLLTTIDLSDLSNLKTIDDDFMKNCTSLTNIVLPKNIKTISNNFLMGCTSLTNIVLPKNIKTISNNFLMGCTGLTTIDLSELSTIDLSGNNFMNNCTSLTNIVLPKNIKTISNNFLMGCTGLTTIDLSDLSILETIGHDFMQDCSGLLNIVFPKNIKTIGHGLMMNCTKLETIDLSDLSILETIGNDFMQDCSGLLNIVLPKNIKFIGKNFMNNCTKLETIDLSDLSILETIGHDFMNNCTSLTNIVLPKNIKFIGHGLMMNCTKLETIDLSGLLIFETIGNDFMRNCTSLTNIVLPKNIKSIGHCFMMNCTGLSTIDLSDLSILETIGHDFMEDCSGLLNIVLPKNIKSIGNNFMEDCTKLETLDLSELSKLETISNYFMRDCKSLTNIVLPKNIQYIDKNFMNNCTGLTTIDLTGLSNLETIDKNFMRYCTGLTNIVLPQNIQYIDKNFMNNCTGLTNIVLPQNIQYIGENFMNNCTGLTSIDLTGLSNLNSIKYDFMENCTKLLDIKINRNKVSILLKDNSNPDIQSKLVIVE